MTPRYVARVAGRASALAVKLSATVILVVLAVISPYPALVRVLLVVAACGAAIGVATGFVKLRQAVSGDDLANPS